MGVLRADRVSGLGGANAIVGSTRFAGSGGNGSGKTVTYFKDPSLAPGTSDFCAEAWVYFNWVDGTNNTQIFANLGGNFGFANDTSWAVIRIGASNQFFGWSGSGWVSFGAGAPTVNTWHYIQLVRSSNVFTLYLDGTALGSTVSNSNDLTNDEVYLGGRDDGSEVLDGYISNFRLTIGSSASALAGIVPSAASRVLSTDTKLLCCNDPGNVNNEDAQGIPTSTTPDNDVQMIQGFASRFVPDKGEDYGTTFADGAVLDTLSYMVPPGGTTTQRGRGRAVFAGGNRTPDNDSNIIDYVQIQSSGSSIDFGDLTQEREALGGSGNETRGWFASGYDGDSPNANYDIIDYITISTTANALDFGNLSAVRRYVSCLSNSTRGVIGGGYNTDFIDTIEYITIASIGNVTDFGNLTVALTDKAGLSSPTRGVFAGGLGPAASDVIDYITIATTGNATDFGNLTVARRASASANSSTRGVFGGGHTPTVVNTIDYITIASTGDATDFGDLTAARGYMGKGQSCSVVRGLLQGGIETPVIVNTIEYIDIATTGNAADFGDLTGNGVREAAACSDSHGGIS